MPIDSLPPWPFIEMPTGRRSRGSAQEQVRASANFSRTGHRSLLALSATDQMAHAPANIVESVKAVLGRLLATGAVSFHQHCCCLGLAPGMKESSSHVSRSESQPWSVLPFSIDEARALARTSSSAKVRHCAQNDARPKRRICMPRAEGWGCWWGLAGSRVAGGSSLVLGG